MSIAVSTPPRAIDVVGSRGDLVGGRGDAVAARPRTVTRAAATTIGTGHHRPITWVGLALAVVSLANLALVWASPRFGDARWEYFTVQATVERLPLLILGLGLVGAGAVLGGSVWGARLTSAAFAGLALGVGVLAVLFGLAAVIAFGVNTDPVALLALRRGTLKNGIVLLTYGSLGLALAVWLWTHARRR